MRVIKNMLLLIGLFASIGCANPRNIIGLNESVEVQHPEIIGHRVINVRDLVELRDVSNSVVSPDESHVAFFLCQAQISENTYTSAWFISPIDGHAPPQNVGDAGTIKPLFSVNGKTAGRIGPASKASWAPDSSAIAYLKRKNGAVQIWESDRSTGDQRQLTFSSSDVIDFFWSRNSDQVFYRENSKERKVIESSLTEESERGFHFDDRFKPSYSVRPLSKPVIPSNYKVLDRQTLRSRPASPNEVSRIIASKDRQMSVEGFPNAKNIARNSTSQFVAWSEPIDILENSLVAIVPQTQVMVRTAIGKAAKRCAAHSCVGWIKGIWISSDGSEVYFRRGEGTENWDTVFYAWDIRTDRVRLLYSETDKWLRNCGVGGEALICEYETLTYPRRLAKLNVRTGDIEIFVDENPNFQSIQFSEIRRLEWKNDESLQWGREAYGHLVLPLNYEGGRQYPLIVTQYHSQGFLRGGVGDEYPIHLFAANGFAVLNTQHPFAWDLFRTVSNWTELQQITTTDDWTVNDIDIGTTSLLTGVRRAIETGVIDTENIGITGLSDGVVKGFHALTTVDYFNAASFSGSSWNPILYFTTDNQHRAMLRKIGYSNPYTNSSSRWRKNSPIFRAHRITAPILFHFADHELISASQTITTLQDQNKLFDAYVFPNEYHMKWQPKHRSAIYRRNLDWFRFWLKGEEDPDPEKVEQYERWRELRD